eukprot:9384685-Lingulodinium_polyedra.AAC.1
MDNAIPSDVLSEQDAGWMRSVHNGGGPSPARRRVRAVTGGHVATASAALPTASGAPTDDARG